jgi:manganese transport protein
MDTVFALSLALFVNAAILIVSAATFHRPAADGSVSAPIIPSVAEAYHMLAPILGSKIASALFGVALLASGQNSTLTGTLAGQIIMEGFISVRLKPWLRRLMTRLLVILPAVVTVIVAGEEGVDALLTLSQVVLSLQLPFAVAPLVLFTSDAKIVGTEFVNGPVVKTLGWSIVVFFTGLNAWLVVQQIAAL